MAAPWGHGFLASGQGYDSSPATLNLAKAAGCRLYAVTADVKSPTVQLEVDRGVANVLAAGMEAKVSAAYAPPRMGAYHQVPLTPDAREEWATIVAGLVAKNVGKIRAVEVWNEPNHDPFNTAPHLGRYVDLLNRTYTKVKKADPNCFIITGGTAPRGTSDTGFSPTDWARGLYDQTTATGARISPKFDALGHHPYTFPHPASGSQEWNACHQSLHLAAIVRWCEAVQGKPPKPIWATEVNFPSHPVGAPGRRGSVDEHTQIIRMADLAHTWRSWEFTGPLFWYGVKDAKVLNQDDPPSYGALYHSDGSAKLMTPWFRAMAGVA